MSEEILINVTPQETRVALVENGVLHEVYVERTRKRGLVGNIFKGRVSRVLPGMQAAFIDVGLERTGFLHISDIIGADQSDSSPAISETSIDSILREGQDILVQVVKDPLGTKGARLTTRVFFPLTLSGFLFLTIPASASLRESKMKKNASDFVELLAAIRMRLKIWLPHRIVMSSCTLQ